MNRDNARTQMINQQLRTWKISSNEVLETMAAIPREEFVPQAYRGCAFSDANIPIGHGQVMLAPKLQGRLLQALDLRAGDRVLEIGTGTGFLTACLARLAEHVRSVDIEHEFVEQARNHLDDLSIGNITVETADAMSMDLNKEYDAILVSGSLPVYDDRFEKALAPGGRLSMVVGQSPVMEAQLIIRGDGSCARDVLFETDIPSLKNVRVPEKFVF